jgi:UDP-glucuronate decarboxylase
MSPSDGRVVSNFIVQALHDREITIYGDGLQTRSFCYVDDLIEGIASLMASPTVGTGPINLGNAQECTILELARLVIRLTASRSRIVHCPLPVDDPRQRRPDLSRAKSEFGWAPTIPLADGLKRTINYFDEFLKRGGNDRIESDPDEKLVPQLDPPRTIGAARVEAVYFMTYTGVPTLTLAYRFRTSEFCIRMHP